MSQQRLYWVDYLRSSAILLMLVYHFAFNLNILKIFPIDLYSGLWIMIARYIQFTFFLIVGVSLYLSYKKQNNYHNFVKRQLKRAIKLFGIAMCITLITFFVYPEGYIQFGVLHSLSFSIIIGALLIRNNLLMACLIPPILILSSIFSHIVLNTPLLIPLGIEYKGFYSLDYFPIFPWISLIFTGIILAHFLDDHELLKNYKIFPNIGLFEWIGKSSLAIYLIHQPIFLGLIWLLSKINLLK